MRKTNRSFGRESELVVKWVHRDIPVNTLASIKCPDKLGVEMTITTMTHTDGLIKPFVFK